ncbi:hypothetical protein D3C71_1906030 [compost metagenome]
MSLMTATSAVSRKSFMGQGFNAEMAEGRASFSSPLCGEGDHEVVEGATQSLNVETPPLSRRDALRHLPMEWGGKAV